MPHARPPSIARVIADAVAFTLTVGAAVLVVLTLSLALFPSNRAPMQAPTWSAP